MSIENNGLVWTVDHCYLFSKNNLSNGNDMYISTNWTNLGPMYSNKKISKGAKMDHLLYLMQQMKAKYF